MTAPRTLATIYYTATIFTPSDDDTNVYGEPCAEGHGQTMDEGWIDPQWDMWTVYEAREDVNPDTIESDDGRLEDGVPLADVVRECVEDRLGAIDNVEGDPEDTASWYASDGIHNYRTGVVVMLCAHSTIHEATDGD